ncbi:MAG: hypothetical protein ABIA37_01345 [Candidatus Woesearchaeota archaeon]
MPSNDNDPIESIVKGVVKGGLEWGKEEICSYAKNIADKFRNRDINFIGESETINLVNEQDSKGEFSLFKQKIKDKKYRNLFRLGLTLQELEDQPEKQLALKKSINKHFDIEGLRIAQLVQNGVFSWFVSSLLDRGVTEKKLTKEIEHLFENIDQLTYFVQHFDDPIKISKEIIESVNNFVETPKKS